MRAIIRGTSDIRTATDGQSEVAVASEGGGSIVASLPTGTLVEMSDAAVASLERRGVRVVRLPDAMQFRVGDAVIDIARGAPTTPPRLAVPAGVLWDMHVVHLIAPIEPGWAQQLGAVGLELVEAVSPQGLLVRGDAAAVARARGVSFVDWAGALQPSWKISRSLANVTAPAVPVVMVVDAGADLGAFTSALGALGASAIVVDERSRDDRWVTVRATVPASGIDGLALNGSVRWVELARPREHCGEREVQVIAENLNGTEAQPVVGYGAFLTTLAFNGTGAIVAICDTGVDQNANNNGSAHADLNGRQAAFVDYSAGADAADVDGHGTHVAGIAVGNAATGATEAAAPNNFLWGQGVAPAARYVTQNFLGPNAGNPSDATLARDAVVNGAVAMNNSWAGVQSAASGYDVACVAWDKAVRDANSDVAALQPLIPVFAAANFGGMPTTLGSPAEAKNTIVVGNGLTFRPGVGHPSDNIRGVADSSGRGPTVDGRIAPTVVAPGTDVTAAWARNGSTADYGASLVAGTGAAQPDGTLINAYLRISGTSMAAPHVTGACALITEWWRARTGGKTPSAALVKALLVNSAEDMAGGPNWRQVNRNQEAAQWSLVSGSVHQRPLNGIVPQQVWFSGAQLTLAAGNTPAAAGQYALNAGNLRVWLPGNVNPGATNARLSVLDASNVGSVPDNNQGWGRVSLENLFFQTPASDRGPRLYLDQTAAFTASGQQHRWTVAPIDPARPMRVTLAWTDAPGAAGAAPALVNNLNLEVARVGTATLYRGNNFANGFSVAGGAADTVNNVECVYVQSSPVGATYEVRVVAAAVVKDARPNYSLATPWQDFALVVENAAFVASEPVSVATVIDRSGSMVSSGYVDATRTAARQFIDLMQVGDSVGVVSFGATGTNEFGLTSIASGADQTGAKNAVNAISFSGNTYMGDGIAKGGAMLGATGRRALVLLSDGYDNKGGDPNNPAKPSATQAAAALASGINVHACAMGPLSDQALLQSLASSTGGRYYYMPTIDDLLEVYNFIRGGVTGDSLSVNDSATASSSRVAAWVDGLATRCTFVVSWTARGLVPVRRAARTSNEICVLLRDPSGRLVPGNASWVRRVDGDGYSIFRVEEPAAGRWYMEVQTARADHTRYQAACFVKSGLKLRLRVPGLIRLGAQIPSVAQVFIGDRTLDGARARLTLTRPLRSIDDAIRVHGGALGGVALPVAHDVLDGGRDRLATLLGARFAAGQDDVLPHARDTFGMATAAPVAATPDISPIGHSPGVLAVGPHLVRDLAAAVRLDLLRPTLRPDLFDLARSLRAAPVARVAGSHNVVVEVSGVDEATGTRYVRKDMASVVVS